MSWTPSFSLPAFSMPKLPTIEVTPSGGIRINQAKTKSATRLDNASKTGVFALQDKHLMSFPSAALEIEKLRTLHIENCGLSKVPSEIAKVAATLQRLKMPRNKLKDLPQGLERLERLEQMDFSCNVLKAMPECFMAMQKLKELCLAQNELEVLPGSVSALEALRVLDVSNNRLVGLPEGVSRLANLEDLDAGSNRLQRFPTSCEGMKRIRRINLENNVIKAMPASLLTETPVEMIKLDGNPLEGGLEKVEGYEVYAERKAKQMEKETAQRVGTGDLSKGLGAAKKP